MQTFLPYAGFEQSARCLDHRRLGKQRVEAKLILTTLMEGGDWAHHPAVCMWRGHELVLARYGAAVCEEWVNRGSKDQFWQWFVDVSANLGLETTDEPSWLGDPALHASHRSNLLRQDPTFYKQYGWKEPPDLPFVWPVSLM